MKRWKELVSVALAAVMLFLAGCAEAPPDGGPRGELPSAEGGVSLTFDIGIEDPYRGETRIANGGDSTICFGGYILQHRWGDFWMTESNGLTPDDRMLETIVPGESRSLGITLWPYLPLESGLYRVVFVFVRGDEATCGREALTEDGRRVILFDPPEDAERLTLAAVFPLP